MISVAPQHLLAMTPEQEQWLIRAVQELQAAQQEMRLVQQNQQLLIQELREGQAMLAQFFREALDRLTNAPGLLSAAPKPWNAARKRWSAALTRWPQR